MTNAQLQTLINNYLTSNGMNNITGAMQNEIATKLLQFTVANSGINDLYNGDTGLLIIKNDEPVNVAENIGQVYLVIEDGTITGDSIELSVTTGQLIRRISGEEGDIEYEVIYTPASGSSPQTFAQTLVQENVTDGNDIVVSNGDRLVVDENRAGIGRGIFGGVMLACIAEYKLIWFQGKLYTLDSSDLINVVNYTTAAPISTDDETQYYKVGSRWINNDGTAYTCLDPTEGAAVWQLESSSVVWAKEVQAADLTELDTLDIETLPTNVFVTDDGDGDWALYKATTTGVGGVASYIKISDPNLLNAEMTPSMIKAAYESVANAFTDDYLGVVDAIFNLGIIYYRPGGYDVFNAQQARLKSISPFGYTSIDWHLRKLYANDGTEQLDYNTPGQIGLEAFVSKFAGQATAGNGLVAIMQILQLTIQSSSIASTLLSNKGGTYFQLNIMLRCSTSGTGTVTVTITWTDSIGSKTYTTASLNLASTNNYVQDTLFVVVGSSPNINYSTTVAGVSGSPKYALDINVTRLL